MSGAMRSMYLLKCFTLRFLCYVVWTAEDAKRGIRYEDADEWRVDEVLKRCGRGVWEDTASRYSEPETEESHEEMQLRSSEACVLTAYNINYDDVSRIMKRAFGECWYSDNLHMSTLLFVRFNYNSVGVSSCRCPRHGSPSAIHNCYLNILYRQTVYGILQRRLDIPCKIACRVTSGSVHII